MRDQHKLLLMSLNDFRDDTTVYCFCGTWEVGRGNLQKIDKYLQRWEDHADALNSNQKMDLLKKIIKHCKTWLDTHTQSKHGPARKPSVEALLASALKHYRYLAFQANKARNPNPVGPMKGLQGAYRYEADDDSPGGIHTKSSSRPAASVFKHFIDQAYEDGRISTDKFSHLTGDDYKVLEQIVKEEQEDYPSEVAYYSKVERLDCLAIVDSSDGKIKADPYTDMHFGSTKQAHFVIDGYGNIFIKTGQDYLFQHSTFNRGKEVLCAGFMMIDHGIIKLINNGSGHYCPTEDNLWSAVDLLKTYGANLGQAMVWCFDKPTGMACGLHGAACPDAGKVIRFRRWNSALNFWARNPPSTSATDCKQVS